MTAIIDKKASPRFRGALSALGFEVIALEPFDLQAPVASHPDMLIFVGLGSLICHREYYDRYPNVIDSIADATGLCLQLSDEKMTHEYPQDVLFNALLLGDKLVCNTKNTSRLITELCTERHIRLLHTNQGYTRCSTLALDTSTVITADRSISKVCDANGLEVLTISQGGISLPGYDHGFIGGASGVCGDTVFFFGELMTHPDGERISDFICSHGKRIVCLDRGELTDHGGIIFV